MKSMLTMDYQRNNAWYFDYEMFVLFALALITVTISFFIQQQTMNKDVGVIIHETNQMLAGGNYVTSFFETNPPMILYLTVPVCLIAELLSLNPIFVNYCYVSILCILSALLSYYLLTRLVRDKLSSMVVFTVILFAFFILPLHDFGEREQITTVLVMPYVFAAALAFSNKSLNTPLRLLIGIAGGIGFAIKPYFLVPLCFIELSFIFKNSNIFGWVRLESLTVLALMVTYLGAIFYFHPAYIHILLPLINRYYFSSIAIGIPSILAHKAYIFALITMVCSFCYLRNGRNINTMVMLMLTQMGFMISYLVVKTDWYYHIFPALAISLILISLCLATQVNIWITTRRISYPPELIITMTLFMGYFIFYLIGIPIISESLLLEIKMLALLSLSILAVMIMYLDKKAWYLSLAVVVVTLAFAQLRTLPYEIRALEADGYFFIIMDFILAWLALNCVLLSLMFATKITTKWLPALQKSLGLVFLVLIIYFYHLHFIWFRYVQERNIIQTENQIVNYLNHTPGKGGLYCITNIDPGVCINLSYWTHRPLLNSFPSLWWIHGLSRAKETPQLKRDREYLLNVVGNDFAKYHPQFVFISARNFHRLPPGFVLTDFLSRNKEFRREWANYELKRTFPEHSPQLRPIDYYVYERRQDAPL